MGWDEVADVLAEAGVPFEAIEAKAEQRTVATVPCGRCGEPIPIPTDDGVDLSGATVVHSTCPRDERVERPKRWFEARLAIYEHPEKPGEDFGVGGEEVAHARAVVDAPTFMAAFPHLDRLLGERWEFLREAAALADRPVEGG